MIYDICTVVQSTVDYKSEVNTMLSDEHTYEKLKKDPTPGYKRKLVNISQRLKVKDKIDESQYNFCIQKLRLHQDFIALYEDPKIWQSDQNDCGLYWVNLDIKLPKYSLMSWHRQAAKPYITFLTPNN